MTTTRKDGKMERELYKQVDLEAITNGKCLLDQDKELGIKCWEWAEKKAIADYIEGKWRLV